MTNLTFIIPFLMVSVSFSQYLEKFDYAALSLQKNINELNSQDYGFSSDLDNLPSSYSLEKYCYVSDQTGSSCTGFAVANGALSILYNILNNHTEYNSKTFNRFDSYYIYCSIKDNNDLDCIDCGCGSHIDEALDIVVNYGCKKNWIDPSLKCHATLNKNNLRGMLDMTGQYAIDDYYSFIKWEQINNKWNKDMDIEVIKQWISSNNPIIAGINVGDNFSDLSSTVPLYSAAIGEEGGHAITVIGYNDYKYGGAFRILNSYGDDWGDDGFFWMTYVDFEKYAEVAYAMTKEDNNWDSWTDSFSSESFYKGKSESGKLHWEGPLDKDGYFHGWGIITTSDFVASASYKNGNRHGWWTIIENENIEDAWAGYVLYQDGEYVEEESFGFSSSTTQSIDALKAAFHCDDINLKLSNEIMTEEELLPSITSPTQPHRAQ